MNTETNEMQLILLKSKVAARDEVIRELMSIIRELRRDLKGRITYQLN